jgi:hypothetical protein
MAKKYGFSFSLKRALGISAAKGRLSRQLGVPLTRTGMERKAGRFLLRQAGCATILPLLAVGGWCLRELYR